MSTEIDHDEDERIAVTRKPLRQARGASRKAGRAEHRENRDLDERVREASVRSLMRDMVLPDPPKIPGFHLAWLSTNNPYDPIHSRMRLGYTPVRPNEIPDFDPSLNMKTGDFEGAVACKEMVLFKIPDERYQDIMAELHHTMPNEEDTRLRASVEALEDELRRRGSGMTRGDKGGDGYATLRGSGRTPRFAD